MPQSSFKIALDRRLVIAGMAAVVSGAGAWWWWAHRAAPPVEWQGYAEADFIKVGPTQAGQLVSLHVARGDKVAITAPLFDQDDTADRAATEQATKQLEQAEDQFANLQSGGKQTEIAQAEGNLADAKATRERTQQDLTRAETLARTGAGSRMILDQSRAASLSAAAKAQALEAALNQQRAPMGRAGEIKGQEAMVGAARAAVAMAQWRLDQRRVTAPVAGVVADVFARPGETVQAGAPVVSLLPPDNIFIRFFIPEPMLAKVHRGDDVALLCDSCPAGLRATISFISPQSEYTPPVIYSESSRSKLVYLIEARLPPDKAILLNPGQPVAVRPLWKADGR